MNRPLLKYCGQQSLEDLQLSAMSSADYLGFIFYDKSPRYVEPGNAGKWVRETGTKGKQLVGVFVNPTMEEINDVLQKVDLDVIQLHGSEKPDYALKVKKVFGKKVWKAIHHDSLAIHKMEAFSGKADGYVVDVKVKHLWGGTGQSFDWKAVPQYTDEAFRQDVPCFIAGGVSPQNIEQLLSYRPIGIDMASGIEHNGKKSKDKILEIERKVVAVSDLS
ncbi:MAG: phosphoribosylanthranilate isomerase [Tuberibacillus sp.]